MNINEEIKFTTEEIRQKYNNAADKYAFFEPIQEHLMGVAKYRRKLLKRIRGKTLEVAVGTGRNLLYYPAACQITAVDSSEEMLRIAQANAEKWGIHVEFKLMDAESLSFPDDSFDTVVSTLSTCTYPNPVSVLRELARVCRKGGRILLLEHGRSNLNWLGNYQDRTVKQHAQEVGCIWNRDPLDIVKQSELQIISHSRHMFGVFHLFETSPVKN